HRRQLRQRAAFQKGRRRLDGGDVILLRPAMRRLLAAVILLAAPAARADHTVGCLVRSGKAGVRCLAAYTGAIERCRRTVDVACETALRAPGGTLDRLVAQVDAASRVPCTAADADVLGYVGALAGGGPRFAALGLAPEPGVAAQLDDVLDRVVDRARHFAESVYPPHTLGPTAEPGPFPVGVQTLALVDPSRTDVTGSGPRPVTIEVYYPSTPPAVAGGPDDTAKVLGVAVAQTPAFRDVARPPA